MQAPSETLREALTLGKMMADDRFRNDWPPIQTIRRLEIVTTPHRHREAGA